MENDTNFNEKAYTTSEIATMLDMAVPTVRKYSQSLERGGYVFIKGKGKGKHPSRLFIQNDITAFRYLKQLRENSNITVDEASSIVISKFGKGAIQTIRHDNTGEKDKYDKQYDDLKSLIQQQTETINKQNDLIERLTDRLDQQHEQIQSIKDSQLLLTENETKKRSFFQRIFNKK